MNLKDIENFLILNTSIRSKLYFDRYIKFIEGFVKLGLVKPKPNNGEFECHHIIPKGIFPEYKSNSWNKVIMPAKAHYLAHYLLFKAIFHHTLIFSFNQMRRVTKTTNPNCRLYAAVRKDVAELIRKTNTGKIRSTVFRKNVSERMSGKNNYRNEQTNEIKSFLVGQQPTGWVSFQKNRKRTKESKDNMADIMSGRIWQYNEITKEVRFEKTLLPGFVQGYPEWIDASKESIKLLNWAYNPDSGESVRINPRNGIPDGFILGRLYDNIGLKTMNNADISRVVDLQEKTFCMVSTKTLPHPRYIKHGASIDKIYLYEYNNIVYTSYKDLIELNAELPDLEIRSDALLLKCIPKPHSNMTDARIMFCTKNQGKTMNDIGLKIIKLSQFEYKEDKIYVRR